MGKSGDKQKRVLIDNKLFSVEKEKLFSVEKKALLGGHDRAKRQKKCFTVNLNTL